MRTCPVKSDAAVAVVAIACKWAIFCPSASQDEGYLRKLAEKMPDVGKKVEYMLNTGNLVSKSGLDLSQAAGFTVVAEKLNFFR